MQRQRGRANIFFTGLSAVPTSDVFQDVPFSPSTRSGGLLREIASELGSEKVYYTNLVKCLPLREEKIRYPARSEMELCFRNYKAELSKFSPSKIVLFGKQVSEFISHKLDLKFSPGGGGFDFPMARKGSIEFLAAYHPSFVLVYKRKQVESYKLSIASFVNSV